jgi:hypothetical protein
MSKPFGTIEQIDAAVLTGVDDAIVVPNTLWKSADPTAYDSGLASLTPHLAEILVTQSPQLARFNWALPEAVRICGRHVEGPLLACRATAATYSNNTHAQLLRVPDFNRVAVG